MTRRIGNPYSFLAAIQASNHDNYIHLRRGNETFSKGSSVAEDGAGQHLGRGFLDIVFLIGVTDNPEEILIKKQRLEKLSDKAMEVINLIMDDEKGMLSEKRKIMSRKGIERFLRREWGKRKEVKMVMDEIEKFIRSL